MNLQLRDYQQAGVAALRERFRRGDRNVLFQLPTGGGKTVVFCYIAEGATRKGNCVLILVHRQELIRQTSASLAEIGVPHGIIAPGYTPSWEPVQVASVQTLVRRLDKIHPPQLIISDECFPAGTMIDGRPIESLHVGDIVRSFNHVTNEIEMKPITRLFRSRPKQMIVVYFDDGTAMPCTPGHPFFAEGRYVSAATIGGLHCVRIASEFNNKGPTGPLQEDRSGLLRSCMLQGVQPQGVVRNGHENQQGACLREDEAQQPHAEIGGAAESECHPQGDRPLPHSERGQWEGGNKSSEASCSASGGSCPCCPDGVRPEDRYEQGFGISKSLQNRRGNTFAQGCHRTGWGEPWHAGTAVTGHQEGIFFETVRVDRVEVQERDGLDGPPGVCPDGFVYNIEVEGNHNYFANGVLVHNCHHSGAASWTKIFAHFSKANILGVTATPCRLDGKGLGRQCGGFFDSMVHGPSVAELIARGFLARPRLFAPPIGADLSHLRKKYGEFVAADMAAALDKPVITGCAVEHYRKICPGVPAIAFCASIAHAEHVAEEFRAAGYQAASIDGTMHDSERKGRITALGNGGLNVLTSCDIISEGTDIPIVGAAILLRPTASLGLYLQQVGRALRIYSGKTEAVILDHVGNTMRHGLPEEDREWTLDGDMARKGKKADDEKDITVKQCERCFAVHTPAPTCPFCGYVYEVVTRQIAHADGELVELDKERLEEIERQRARMFAKREEGRCSTLEDFEALAKQRGYKPGWARHRWMARQQRQGART